MTDSDKTNMVMLSIVKRIRAVPEDRLRDEKWLERMIEDAGADFGGIEKLDCPGLWRGGMKLKQLPCQLAKYLNFLSTQSISSYIEIGVANGGTFIITAEYLKRFKAPTECFAVDIELPSEMMKQYLSLNTACLFMRTDTQSGQFPIKLAGSTFDYCLIDGNHTAPAVRKDYETMKPLCRLIGFHDIIDQANQPGVVEAWRSIPKELWNTFENQYGLKPGCDLALPIMGLGVIGFRPEKKETDGKQ